MLFRNLRSGRGRLSFVMLNANQADDKRDDPITTIRRCLSFASLWGFKRLEVVNLLPARTGIDIL
ncbi:MAG: DUF1643 domain-containing protein [Candidatus Obscuribacterales bacterium]|nr:DUF1643 domain-containing protein [Candidatus Obscuribacterales bacterium]